MRIKNISCTGSRAWVNCWKLEPVTRPCTNCGKLFTANIPTEAEDMVGFEAPLHECGPRYQLRTWIPKSKQKRKEWKEMVQSLIT